MIRSLALAAALFAATGLHAPSATADEPAMLTVGGAIAESNRGPSGKEDETMLGAHDVAFDKGFAVTRAMLAGLPQHTIEIMLPDGTGAAAFNGPRLADVLELAGAAKGTISVVALDGYRIAMEQAFLDAHRPILAIAADGASMAIGDFGPAMIVFPPTDDADLQKTFDDYQVWAVFYIGVS